MTSCRWLAIALILPGLAAVAAAQGAAPPAASAEQPVVVEKLATEATFEKDGTGNQEISAAFLAQTSAGVQGLAVLAFPHTQGLTNVSVEYVRVRHPDGTVVATPPENMRDLPADVSRQAPMYSDAMVEQVVVKGLGVGDTLEYGVRIQQVKPDVPNQFWTTYAFQRALVCKDEEFEFSVPADETGLTVYSPGLTPEIRVEGGRRFYRWHTSNPAAAATAVAFDPDRAGASVQITTFQSWKQVGDWYAGVQEPMVQVTAAVRAKEEELTKGLSDDDARIRALYTFVATRIHYVSLSFGIGRYQPHTPDEVLSNGYGDCKDKHTLLAALLRAAGFRAWPALVNSAGVVSKSVPSPGQFDHLVTVVARGSQLMWMDTTAEVAPMGWLSPALRGHPALLMAGDAPAALVEAPSDFPFAGFDNFRMEGKLSMDGNFTGHATSRELGDAGVILRAAFRAVPEARWNDLVHTLLPYMGFGGTPSAVQASPPDDITQPFQYTFDYTRDGYGDWGNQRVQAPLPAIALPAHPKDATQPIELGAAKSTIDYSAALTLPAGATLTPLTAVDVVDDFAEYHATYSFHDGVLAAERRVVIKKSKVEAADAAQYDAFTKSILDDENRSMDVSLPPGAAGGSSAEEKAANLVRSGYAAIEARQYDAAATDLRQAVTLDPKNNDAWNDLGEADLYRGQLVAAEADLQQAIALNANDPYAYNNLGRVYQGERQLDKAETAYRHQLTVAPDDKYAHANLGALLLQETKYAEAASELKRATTLADNAQTEYQLGEAQFGLHQPDLAIASMDRAVQMQPSPLLFNNVAYAFADQNVELDKAKQYAQSALSSLEGLLAGADLNHVSVIQLANVDMLGMTWDTLGWVDFQQDDLAGAESYVAAAWDLTGDDVEADHLGRVFEKEGKTAKAEAAYAAARMEGPPHARERLTELAGSSEKANDLVEQHSGDAFQASIVPVRRTAPGAATADFFVVMAPGPKVLQVHFIHGDEALRSATAAIAAASFKVVFPAHDSAQIIRRGTLACSGGDGPCHFKLMPPNKVVSVQ